MCAAILLLVHGAVLAGPPSTSDVLEWLNLQSPALTAAATIVLAFVTGYLVWQTRNLWRASVASTEALQRSVDLDWHAFLVVLPETKKLRNIGRGPAISAILISKKTGSQESCASYPLVALGAGQDYDLTADYRVLQESEWDLALEQLIEELGTKHKDQLSGEYGIVLCQDLAGNSYIFPILDHRQGIYRQSDRTWRKKMPAWVHLYEKAIRLSIERGQLSPGT
jgi:hypothetical protein